MLVFSGLIVIMDSYEEKFWAIGEGLGNFEELFVIVERFVRYHKSSLKWSRLSLEKCLSKKKKSLEISFSF